MRSVLTRLLLFGLLLTLGAAAVGYQLIIAPLAPALAVRYQVNKGASLTQVAAALEERGVVRSAWSLKLLASRTQQGGQIHVGSYLFKTAASPQQVLDRLTRGDVEQVMITLPEGFTLEQIIQRFADAGYGDLGRLQELASSREFATSLQIDAKTLEGYLFPETYLFTPGMDEAELLKMLVAEFQRNLSPKLLQQAKQLQLNRHQLVTLASIIEKETGRVDEMPLISSVFHNRLRKKIPLQTDPTVIYGIANFDGNLTRKHLLTPTPYNTYVIRGLPPGPIASPGRAALQAAANPAQSKYLYFVARGDGSHQFSKTLKEHNLAVRQYQLRRPRK